jgi:hypothetical protein
VATEAGTEAPLSCASGGLLETKPVSPAPNGGALPALSTRRKRLVVSVRLAGLRLKDGGLPASTLKVGL